MDDASFQRLCRDACIELNQPDVDALATHHQITVDGVEIGLFFDALDIKDRLVCYIDIGDVPDLDREEILERILAINLLSGTKTSGVYGLDRERDRIIFVQHFLFPDLLSGEVLAEILRGYAAHAKGAQTTFMDASNSSPLSSLLEQSLQSPIASFA
jgi:hypothetical protein